MEKMFIGLIFGVIVGLLCGSLGGMAVHEYELDKCNVLSSSTNQDYYNYELQSNCYFVLEKTGWNLFWAMFAFSLIGMFFFGFIGAVIGEISD